MPLGGLPGPEAEGAQLRLPSFTLESQHGLLAMAQPSRCTEVTVCASRVPRPQSRGAGLSWAGPPPLRPQEWGRPLASQRRPPTRHLGGQVGTLPAWSTCPHLECLLTLPLEGLWELLLDPPSQPGPRSTMLAQAPSGLDGRAPEAAVALPSPRGPQHRALLIHPLRVVSSRESPVLRPSSPARIWKTRLGLGIRVDPAEPGGQQPGGHQCQPRAAMRPP